MNEALGLLFRRNDSVELWALLLPLLFVAIVHCLTSRLDESRQPEQWILYRRVFRIFILVLIPTWWSVLVLRGHRVSLPLLLPAFVSVLIAQWVAFSGDRCYLARRWSTVDMLRLSWWGSVAPTGSLLLLAIGIDAAYDRRLISVVWFLWAAFAALVGSICFRTAEGVRFRDVKSGELYKRASAMSKRYGVRLKRVCVVPFGRGHLTNAFGVWNGIAITDDYGHWLRGNQLDFVIAHELAHVKGRHGLKKLLALASAISLAAIVAPLLPRRALGVRVVMNFTAILLPLIVFNYVSRQYEYLADRDGVEISGADNAVRTLVTMYAHAGLPSRGAIADVFSTHPSLRHRIEQIEKSSKIPSHHFSEELPDT